MTRSETLEMRRKARWKVTQNTRKKRRSEVRALVRRHGQAEAARLSGLSRQRVFAILKAD